MTIHSEGEPPKSISRRGLLGGSAVTPAISLFIGVPTQAHPSIDPTQLIGVILKTVREVGIKADPFLAAWNQNRRRR